MISLLELRQIIVLQVRHALKGISLMTNVSAKRQRLVLELSFLITAQARSNKSFILFFYVKPFRSNQGKGHFARSVQRDQLGTIAKELNRPQSSLLTTRP